MRIMDTNDDLRSWIESSMDSLTEIYKIKGRRITMGSAYVGRFSMRRFHSFFGTSPSVWAKTWNLLEKYSPKYSKPKHLLWCLFFLKSYCTEDIASAIFQVDRKTFRKWVWLYVKFVSQLKLVSLLSVTTLATTNSFLDLLEG